MTVNSIQNAPSLALGRLGAFAYAAKRFTLLHLTPTQSCIETDNQLVIHHSSLNRGRSKGTSHS